MALYVLQWHSESLFGLVCFNGGSEWVDLRLAANWLCLLILGAIGVLCNIVLNLGCREDDCSIAIPASC